MTWAPHGLGLAGSGAAQLRETVLPAWDTFCELVRECDLGTPSRLQGWTGRDLCVHLGSWPDAHPLDRVLDAARAGDTGLPPHPDDANAALLARHRHTTTAEVVAALEVARDRVRSFLESAEADELGHVWVGSTVGPLPVLTVVLAGCYELAVHALDLQPCGVPEPPAPLLAAGLAALVDVTGALAARHGVTATVAARAPQGAWRFHSDAGTGWRTEQEDGDHRGGAVEGDAADLLDASAGRQPVPKLMLRGRLKVHGLPTLLRLTPIVEEVPGLPGGAALRRAAGVLSGSAAVPGRLLGRLTGR